MKVKIFAIYDSKAEAYLQPFFMPARGQAIRAFTEAVNDKSTNFYKHAEDYTLFEIGEYDDATAGVTALNAKTSLGCAIEFRRDDKELTPLKSVVDSAMLDIRDRKAK